jgi:hypothetical protein
LKSKQKNTPKVQNAQWGALKGKKRNLRPKPITNNTKQRDGQKTWKDTKPRKSFPNHHNYSTQDNGNVNSLKNH